MLQNGYKAYPVKYRIKEIQSLIRYFIESHLLQANYAKLFSMDYGFVSIKSGNDSQVLSTCFLTDNKVSNKRGLNNYLFIKELLNYPLKWAKISEREYLFGIEYIKNPSDPTGENRRNTEESIAVSLLRFYIEWVRSTYPGIIKINREGKIALTDFEKDSRNPLLIDFTKKFRKNPSYLYKDMGEKLLLKEPVTVKIIEELETCLTKSKLLFNTIYGEMDFIPVLIYNESNGKVSYATHYHGHIVTPDILLDDWVKNHDLLKKEIIYPIESILINGYSINSDLIEVYYRKRVPWY